MNSTHRRNGGRTGRPSAAGSTTIRGSAHRQAYAWFALLIPATVLGFWPTYFGILGDLPDKVTPVIHVHAASMVLWLVTLVSQAWFVRARRFALHRWVGRSSFVIAPAIVWLGLAALQETRVMHLGFWTFTGTEGWLAFCQWFADLPSLGG